MWTKRLVLYVALFALLSGPVGAQTDSAVKVALIADKAFDLHESPLVSLLEAKLSALGPLLRRPPHHQARGQAEEIRTRSNQKYVNPLWDDNHRPYLVDVVKGTL